MSKGEKHCYWPYLVTIIPGKKVEASVPGSNLSGNALMVETTTAYALIRNSTMQLQDRHGRTVGSHAELTQGDVFWNFAEALGAAREKHLKNSRTSGLNPKGKTLADPELKSYCGFDGCIFNYEVSDPRIESLRKK